MILEKNKEIKYKLPFSDKLEKKIASPKGKYAHENFIESKYAIDFLLDIGTPILSARDGVVIKIKQDSDKYGLDEKLTKEVNFVLIKHTDESYAEYVHFGKNEVMVESGQNVKEGELLGYTGLSGVMDVPHLHFNVFKIVNHKPVSIRVNFE